MMLWTCHQGTMPWRAIAVPACQPMRRSFVLGVLFPERCTFLFYTIIVSRALPYMLASLFAMLCLASDCAKHLISDRAVSNSWGGFKALPRSSLISDWCVGKSLPIRAIFLSQNCISAGAASVLLLCGGLFDGVVSKDITQCR